MTGMLRGVVLNVLLSSLATAGLLCSVSVANAQERVSAPRPDGHETPLMVYRSGGSCANLAVISPGAGGSENGFGYLAQSLQSSGFMVIVMGHRESGMEALRASIRSQDMQGGVQALVGSRDAEAARLLDTDAALAWADHQCHSSFRVLLGHSMGAETVMLEAGAKNALGIASPPVGQRRFNAYVAMSPEGPGLVFPEHAWSGITAPVYVLTGTRDETMQGGGGPEARQIPWQQMPGAKGQCQWLGVIDGATHLNFAGAGFGAQRVEMLTSRTVAGFIAGVKSGACRVPATGAGMTLHGK